MAACKITVAPHAGKEEKHAFSVSQRGWKEATRRAKNLASSGVDNTIFLACARGDIRIAQCSNVTGELKCRLDAEIGGNSTRVLAGGKRKR